MTQRKNVGVVWVGLAGRLVRAVEVQAVAAVHHLRLRHALHLRLQQNLVQTRDLGVVEGWRWVLRCFVRIVLGVGRDETVFLFQILSVPVLLRH